MTPSDFRISYKEEQIESLVRNVREVENPVIDNHASMLIESIFLRIPLDPLYGYWNYDLEPMKLVLIRGNDLFENIRQFVLGKYKLSDLQVMPDLNGYSFTDLSSRHQRLIVETRMIVRVCDQTASPPIEIFSDILKRIQYFAEMDYNAIRVMEVKNGSK